MKLKIEFEKYGDLVNNFLRENGLVFKLEKRVRRGKIIKTPIALINGIDPKRDKVTNIFLEYDTSSKYFTIWLDINND